MSEVLVIFSLAATGCLVRLSMDLALHFFARRLPSGRTAAGPTHDHAPDAQSKADPAVTLGVTVACYGAIAFVLICELPGELAFQRTMLAVALLSVGGIIGEISRAGKAAEPDLESEDAHPEESSPSSVGLSVALMLALCLAVAVLVSGQGLIQVVPPARTVDNPSTELEQIVVVARRGTDDGSTFL